MRGAGPPRCTPVPFSREMPTGIDTNRVISAGRARPEGRRGSAALFGRSSVNDTART